MCPFDCCVSDNHIHYQCSFRIVWNKSTDNLYLVQLFCSFVIDDISWAISVIRGEPPTPIVHIQLETHLEALANVIR